MLTDAMPAKAMKRPAAAAVEGVAGEAPVADQLADQVIAKSTRRAGCAPLPPAWQYGRFDPDLWPA